MMCTTIWRRKITNESNERIRAQTAVYTTALHRAKRHRAARKKNSTTKQHTTRTERKEIVSRDYCIHN